MLDELCQTEVRNLELRVLRVGGKQEVLGLQECVRRGRGARVSQLQFTNGSEEAQRWGWGRRGVGVCVSQLQYTDCSEDAQRWGVGLVAVCVSVRVSQLLSTDCSEEVQVQADTVKSQSNTVVDPWPSHLEVPVDDPPGVTVLQSTGDLDHHVARLRLGELALGHHPIVQFPARHEFHHLHGHW